ncbi:MAG: hypothetical protein HeimC3_34290 [Candidatus Heimdallarchaeota archaeon LC_3]|nr:MAG: hypothetical protein HeimC3_34290 [Candidatus Heimdallarchaeota archaeon LC_3]
MKCHFCRKVSSGICKYCGRGICDDHRITGPVSLINSLDLKDELIERNFDPYLLWCGKCVSDQLLEELQIGNLEALTEPDSTKESCAQCNSVIEVTDVFCSQCGERTEL